MGWRTAVVGAALVAAACGHGISLWRPDGADTGEQVYRRACARCHGLDGKGDGPDARSLRTAPKDLTTLRARAGGTYPRALVIDVITGERDVDGHGAREMPVWQERFEPVGGGAPAVASLYARQRTEALADYVETLQRP